MVRNEKNYFDDQAAAGYTPVGSSAQAGQRSRRSFCVSEMDVSTAVFTMICASGSADVSYVIFRGQSESLKAAFSPVMDGTFSSLGTAVNVLQSIDGAIMPVYCGARPLDKYITPLTSELYAARVAAAIRAFHPASAQRDGRRCKRDVTHRSAIR